MAKTVIGIDEVGRGAWAGPLVVGAIILDKKIDGLKDSKLLSKAQREILALEIKAKTTAVGIGWVEPAEIDKLGLTSATALACERALTQIKSNYDEIIIDGAINFLANNPKAKNLIKADQTVPSVSAASIIAKVARDKYMKTLSLELPNYGFENHVGYGTKIHLESLVKFGISAYHRKSYKPVQALL